MRRSRFAAVLFACAALAAAVPAAAADEELPKFPKARPPEPLPDPPCDASHPDGGAWLLGNWVGPQTRLSFTGTPGTGKPGDLHWTMDRKGGPTEFGWQQGAVIDGEVAEVSRCTLRLVAGGGAFTFEGVLTEDGHIYGFASNTAGDAVRFILRRER